MTHGDHLIATPLALQRNTKIDVQPGARLTVSNLSSIDVSITKIGGGQLNVNRVIANGLAIAGGTISVTGAASKFGALSFAMANGEPLASLDLTNQDAVITGMPRSAMESMIAAARPAARGIATA